MTGLHIRQCPRCELRFTSSSELDYHLSNDHHKRPSAHDERPAPALLSPASTPPRAPFPSVPSIPMSPRVRVPVWMVTLAGAALIIVVALFEPTSTALITTGLVVGLVVCYRWRARVRMRLRNQLLERNRSYRLR